MLVRLSLPGPGTYKAEEGLDNTSRHPVAPVFSLAAPWQPPRPTSARPGPGAYRSFYCILTIALDMCCCEALCVLGLDIVAPVSVIIVSRVR